MCIVLAMAAQERGTAEESPNPARPPETLPSNRWEFLGWACTKWDRWLRAVAFVAILAACLVAVCLVAGKAGSEAITFIVSR
jgi:hypothetical protein